MDSAVDDGGAEPSVAGTIEEAVSEGGAEGFFGLFRAGVDGGAVRLGLGSGA